MAEPIIGSGAALDLVDAGAQSLKVAEHRGDGVIRRVRRAWDALKRR